MSSAKRPIEPLSGGTLVLGALAIGMANFMMVLDTTIANVAVPTISGNLGVAPDQGTWVLTSFSISLAIGLPLTGWLAQRFGQVKLFLSAVVLFVLASVCCGLAPNLTSLLVFRVFQGAVCGPLAPLSQALLVAIFPPARRTTALVVWSMTTFLGPVCGPILGGYLTDNISWPWIFYINVPVGIFILLALGQVLSGRDNPTRKLPVDVVGLLLLMVAVGSLQILLDKGQDLDWFASTPIRTLGVITVLGFASLITWELTAQHPILDLRLFKERNYAIGTLCVSLGFALYFASLVLVPLWLQTEMGYTATWAGIATAPLGIAGVALAPFIGRMMQHTDARVLASMAFICWIGASLWRMHFETNLDIAFIGWNSVLMGAGTAFLFTPLVAISLSRLPPEKIPAALGLQNALRMTGASFAVSLGPAFWDHRARQHQVELAERMTPFDHWSAQAQDNLGQLGLSAQGALESLGRTIDRQAHMLALNDFSLASAWLFCAVLAIVWMARSPKAKAK
ncbi:DHA2 family efflux MFS transporter permease subunit [Pseudomonas xantholysinigenes]|uniref:DHA2 family efflux MFS transporter permease subunit n=1 Tax=Pseudomonas xantholysinigenes TaxID=2745490 RepID=A0A9E6PUF2_9PSED|nr:DHA2 family efflux MFS transporter permease subunit [Pseudomonas xantholysinigenes]QXI37288.1 DHA2 family efflux MFS transporter permease subunit [Pseudomonas xantholysinigenes]